MGGSQSLPIPLPQLQKKPTPPQIQQPISCSVRKVELNQLNFDVKQKQEEVDTCDPQGAQARRTAAFIAENQTYATNKTGELRAASSEYERQKALEKKIS